MIKTLITPACVLLTGFLAFGCGSDDPAPPDTLNLTKISREVINEGNCGGPSCHTGTVAGFQLVSAGQLHAELVGKAATGAECGPTGRILVVPSDSANSLLYQKIAGMAPCGDNMPVPPSAPLSADKIELVRQWIDEGAVK